MHCFFSCSCTVNSTGKLDAFFQKKFITSIMSGAYIYTSEGAVGFIQCKMAWETWPLDVTDDTAFTNHANY